MLKRLTALILLLAVATPSRADTYRSRSWTILQGLTESNLQNFENGIQDAMTVGMFSNLVVIAGQSAADEVVITADALNCHNAQVTTKVSTTVVYGVNKTLNPTNATIALNGQDTGFTAATGTWYGVYVLVKADGTTTTCISQNHNQPNTADSTWDDYIYFIKVTEVLNEASGSWDIRQFYQIGSRVRPFLRELALSVSGGSSVNQTHSLSPEVAPAARLIDLFVTTSTGSGSNDIDLLSLSSTGPIFVRVATTASTGGQELVVPGYPSTNRDLYYSWSRPSGTGSVNIYVIGYTLAFLAR